MTKFELSSENENSRKLVSAIVTSIASQHLKIFRMRLVVILKICVVYIVK